MCMPWLGKIVLWVVSLEQPLKESLLFMLLIRKNIFALEFSILVFFIITYSAFVSLVAFRVIYFEVCWKMRVWCFSEENWKVLIQKICQVNLLLMETSWLSRPWLLNWNVMHEPKLLGSTCEERTWYNKKSHGAEVRSTCCNIIFCITHQQNQSPLFSLCIW